jgi:hypothetical protein
MKLTHQAYLEKTEVSCSHLCAYCSHKVTHHRLIALASLGRSVKLDYLELHDLFDNVFSMLIGKTRIIGSADIPVTSISKLIEFIKC